MGTGCLPRFFGFVTVAFAIAATKSGSEMIGVDWSWGWALVCAVGFLITGSLASASAKDQVRKRQEAENKRALDSSLRFALLLRPFSADGRLFANNPNKIDLILLPGSHYEQKSIALERLLAQAMKPNIQLRVIGGSPTGPGAIVTSDDSWRDKFHSLAKEAVGIIVIPLPGREILWELDELRKERYLGKTLLLIPPASQAESADSITFRESLRQIGFNIPDPGDKTMILAMDGSGLIIETLQIRWLWYSKIRSVLSQRWGRKYF